MSDFHFVRDYHALVERLKTANTHEQAMDLAVGGNSEALGRVEAEIMRWAGLDINQHIIDFGCGSGRLSWGITHHDYLKGRVRYTGIDIVQELLDSAAKKSASHFKFLLNHTLSLPVASDSQDFINAFSVFTHLHQAEIFIYLGEMHRVLKPGGKAVVSFQSISTHVDVFRQTVATHRAYGKPWPHLNMFIETQELKTLALAHGFQFVDHVPGDETRWAADPLGQNILVLQK